MNVFSYKYRQRKPKRSLQIMSAKKSKKPVEETQPTSDTKETKIETPEMETTDTSKDHEPEPTSAAEVTETTESEQPQEAKKAKSFKEKFLSKKSLMLAAPIIVVIAALFIIPTTRYDILGLFWKQNYQVEVLDSQQASAVSGVTVSLDGKTALTDNKGIATLKVRVGYHQLSITKAYYAGLSQKVLVPIHSKNVTEFKLVATGRHVPVTIQNLISGSPVENASIKVGDTTTQTDSHGNADVVLPANKSSVSATVSGSNYNDATINIQVTTSVVPQNTFKLTPAGKIYFLSNLSGKIDVVKTNLDGTDRQTVVAGTGNETPDTTLYTSRDGKYAALLAIRSAGGKEEINLIDTTNGDKFSNIDKGNANFTVIGWADDYLIYRVDRTDSNGNTTGSESIKSFNAQTGNLNSLDTIDAAAPGMRQQQYTYNGQYVLGDLVVFMRAWYGVNPGQQDTINIIHPDGSGKKTVASYTASALPGQVSLYEPETLLISLNLNNDNSNQTYFTLDGTGSYLQLSAKPSQSDITYQSYYLSPSGNQAFWSALRDGKFSLFVGDQNGNNSKTIAGLTDYTAYGWYTDAYVLLSSTKGNGLYIMPSTGGAPLKVSDYYTSFYGY